MPRTGCFYADHVNVYIDTSDGVNEDLKINEYCGRIKSVIKECDGKPFLFFKSAYSPMWSKNIEKLVEENNGKVIPFFKWSFNDRFYKSVYGKRGEIIKKYKNNSVFEYDIGIFFGDKKYVYPRPSKFDNTISWSDHEKFNIKGCSKNTGHYNINSRNNLISKLKKSKYKILHESLDYEKYVEASFKCKVIINPPGIGEYTSRMFDQTYLGNCIVLRKNSYDNGLSWKNHIPEINFEKSCWELDLKHIIDHYELYQKKSQEYYNNFWTEHAIVNYFKKNIGEYL